MAEINMTMVPAGRLSSYFAQKVAAGAVVREAAGAAYPVMQMAFAQSQKEVPVRTGVLKSSGQLTEPEITSSRFVIAIQYGGAARAYASIQHDDRSLHHPHGGKAGFAIDPVNEHKADIEAAVAQRMKEVFGK